MNPGDPLSDSVCKLCGQNGEIELAGDHYCENCLTSAGSCCSGEATCPN